VSAPLPAQAMRAQVASGYAAGDTILVISPVSLSSYSTFLCIAAGWMVVDKNAHTIGAKQSAIKQIQKCNTVTPTSIAPPPLSTHGQCSNL
jgi:hypothetical protein